MRVKVRKTEKEDLVELSFIHTLCFPRQSSSYLWLTAQLAAFPVSHCFSAIVDKKPAAYAIWIEKSGLRKIKTFELSSIGVHPRLQGKGIGTKLINLSYQWLQKNIRETGSAIGAIMVTTRIDNDRAKKLYEKTLGVKEIAMIPDYLNPGITEAIMFRNLKPNGRANGED